MALKHFRAGKATILSSSRVRVAKVPKQLQEAPGGLYPLRMAHWAVDEYRIANGWPVVVPDHDVSARTLASAEGEVLSDRETPRGIETGARIRWIADEDTFDLTSLQWIPYHSETPAIWTTSAEYSPTFVTEYEYRIDEEVFYQTGLNFDADNFEHMWTNLDESLGGTAGYTVVMCVALNSVYGDNTDVPYAGLWCPGSATPAVGEAISEPPEGGWVSLTLQGNWLYLETDQSRREPILRVSDLLATSAPIMLAMVVDRPYTTLYAGRGPSNITRARANVGSETVPLDGRVVLGRDNGDILHTADMTILDLGVYGEQLSPLGVKNEFALLSSVYGGDK